MTVYSEKGYKPVDSSFVFIYTEDKYNNLKTVQHEILCDITNPNSRSDVYFE